MEKLLKNGKDHFDLNIDISREASEELTDYQLGKVFKAVLEYAFEDIEADDLDEVEKKYYDRLIRADTEA